MQPSSGNRCSSPHHLHADLPPQIGRINHSFTIWPSSSLRTLQRAPHPVSFASIHLPTHFPIRTSSLCLIPLHRYPQHLLSTVILFIALIFIILLPLALLLLILLVAPREAGGGPQPRKDSTKPCTSDGQPAIAAAMASRRMARSSAARAPSSIGIAIGLWGGASRLLPR